MRRLTVVSLAVGLLVPGLRAPAQVDEGARATVTLTATDQSVRACAAAITEQTGVQVAVTQNTNQQLNGTLEGVGVEGAVSLLAAGAQATWLRAYTIERQAPETPYTAEELIDRLDVARRAFWESLGRGAFWENLTAEERRVLLMEWRARSGAPGDAQPPTDGGAPVEAPAGTPGPGVMEGPGGGVAPLPDAAGPRDPMRYHDPVRDLLMPLRSDTISLDLADVPLDGAVREFTLQSGFLVIVDEGLDGVVTLHSEYGGLTTEQLLAQTDADLNYFKSVLAAG